MFSGFIWSEESARLRSRSGTAVAVSIELVSVTSISVSNPAGFSSVAKSSLLKKIGM